MKFYVNNQSEFQVHAATVGMMVGRIVTEYPSVRTHLLDSNGNLRRHFNIFVNGTHIRDLDGLETAFGEDDKVILMASAAGG